MQISLEHLNRGNIVGVLDFHGLVQSSFTGNHKKAHRDLWPLIVYCRWRWTKITGITDAVGAQIDTQEELEIIQEHLTRTYNIQFSEKDGLANLRSHDNP
jgi:hypothetical protein